jgi:hypothetical protein
MTDLPFKFAEIGIWSELKLHIVRQYGAAYTKAFARTLDSKNIILMDSAVRVCMLRKRPGQRLRAALPLP